MLYIYNVDNVGNYINKQIQVNYLILHKNISIII